MKSGYPFQLSGIKDSPQHHHRQIPLAKIRYTRNGFALQRPRIIAQELWLDSLQPEYSIHSDRLFHFNPLLRSASANGLV